ncbi:hypothetical protein N7340_17835, partial [Comamonas aquatica]|uniref:hypothetical protein n=1 Tax=Comamonas aquatica TaxID=225991 RepID=UPI00244BF0B6
VQGGDDAFHIGQRYIALTPLHATHVAAIQAAVMRKTFRYLIPARSMIGSQAVFRTCASVDQGARVRGLRKTR